MENADDDDDCLLFQEDKEGGRGGGGGKSAVAEFAGVVEEAVTRSALWLLSVVVVPAAEACMRRWRSRSVCSA